MKLRCLLFFSTLLWITSQAVAVINITGSQSIKMEAPASSGLEGVFVLENAQGATITYDASSINGANAIKWYKFGVLGGGYAQEIENVTVSGTSSSISISNGDSGYIVEVQGRQHPFWIVDYSIHQPTLSSFSVSPESDCSVTIFNTIGGFDKIVYYSINGAPLELDRGITLEYENLEFTENEDLNLNSWKQVSERKNYSYIDASFYVISPLCDTQFHIFGDRFLQAWGQQIALSSDVYHTKRVESETFAIQDERDNPNEQKPASSGLGGSAPVDITFRAFPTDAVIFREWQFSYTEDFNDVMYRFNEDEFTYTFTEFGTTYVRYVCADASGDCNYEGEVYTITVGESKLLCPNAFSPQNEDGVNDEWKVSYSSLISYDCHIFNRWGKELFSSTDPSQGWDGKVGGKFVPSGVYFYVIKAEGADGVKYNLNGDINIVGSKLRPTTSEIE